MRRSILAGLGTTIPLAGLVLFLVNLPALTRGEFVAAGAFGAAALAAGLPAASAGVLVVRTRTASASILLNLSLVFGALVWVGVAWYVASVPHEHGRLWPFAVLAAGLETAGAFAVGFPAPAPGEHSSTVFVAFLKSVGLGLGAAIALSVAVYLTS